MVRTKRPLYYILIGIGLGIIITGGVFYHTIQHAQWETLSSRTVHLKDSTTGSSFTGELILQKRFLEERVLLIGILNTTKEDFAGLDILLPRGWKLESYSAVKTGGGRQVYILQTGDTASRYRYRIFVGPIAEQIGKDRPPLTNPGTWSVCIELRPEGHQNNLTLTLGLGGKVEEINGRKTVTAALTVENVSVG
ncbi:hypothetical protein [Thermococcus sp.]